MVTMQEHVMKLQALLPPDGLLVSPEDLRLYSYDSQVIEGMPQAVCLPENTDQIAAVMTYCHRHELPVTPRGAGSGTTGGSVPIHGGVVLSLQRMNAIVEIDTDNFVATVQPGVCTADLHKAVEAHGLFYPPDPASMAFSSIGGNIAENAGGMRAVKYGVTAAYVMGLEVVLPDGTIIHTGSKCIKDVVGFNMTPLFVGSEGMLGVITRAYLRLVPLQRCRRTCRIAFRTLADTIASVTNILHEGIVPLTLEFMDALSIKAINKSMNLGLSEAIGGMLIVEIEGGKAQIDAELQTILEVCRRVSVVDVHLANSQEEDEQLWKARRAVPASLLRLKPRRFNEDIVVPRGRISAMSERIQAIATRHNLLIASFGHAGDGNIHVNILSEDTPEELERAQKAVADIFCAATELEGRISGEHGIGLTKKSFFPLNIDKPTMDFMRRLKQILDPKGLLNPGKVFPDAE